MQDIVNLGVVAAESFLRGQYFGWWLLKCSQPRVGAFHQWVGGMQCESERGVAHHDPEVEHMITLGIAIRGEEFLHHEVRVVPHASRDLGNVLEDRILLQRVRPTEAAFGEPRVPGQPFAQLIAEGLGASLAKIQILEAAAVAIGFYDDRSGIGVVDRN